ncbi:hypothetical protein [Staphylospora marina]|uniref:hypothetical protein n=1 Tax=Staphylospora marina TaxID=2490858 RepID=UPI000F5C0261|nr:hypothetical protein [Staphylospora marina]
MRTYDELYERFNYVMDKLEVIDLEIDRLEQMLKRPTRTHLSAEEREQLQRELELLKKEQDALDAERAAIMKEAGVD